MTARSIAIIGMGISGLKTALNLLQNSSHLISSITFFEKNSQLGGVLTHTKENNFLFEHGAQGVLLSRQPFAQCVQELNLQNSVLVPQKKLGTRYLIRNGKCIPLSPYILGFSIIIKIISILFFKKYRSPQPNETLYDFVASHLGEKFADNFLVPFCFGIWGGGAKKLLCRFCLSQFPKFKFKKSPQQPQGLASFPEGMNTLPQNLYLTIQSLCAEKNIQLNAFYKTCVNSILSKQNTLVVNNKNEFDVVIYACQPWQEANLTFGETEIHQTALQTLKQIPTHNLTVVGLGGEKLPHFIYPHGFGALENQNSQDLLGILFIHSTYPKHVLENGFLYRAMYGGDRDLNVNNLSDEELFLRTKNHLKNLNLLHGDEKITFQKIIRYNNVIPLATTYQDKVLTAIWQLEAVNPGLFFTGNYIGGVSVSDCLEQAEKTALKVADFMSFS